jgi:hypothetical protein
VDIVAAKLRSVDGRPGEKAGHPGASKEANWPGSGFNTRRRIKGRLFSGADGFMLGNRFIPQIGSEIKQRDPQSRNTGPDGAVGRYEATLVI